MDITKRSIWIECEGTTDTFSYKSNDGTSDGNTVTVTINITPTNDPPVGVNDTANVAFGGSVSQTTTGSSSLLSNDTDVEGDNLSATLVSSPTHGTVTLTSSGTFIYSHSGTSTASTDSFTYRPSDASLMGSVATVTLQINLPPVTVSDTLLLMRVVLQMNYLWWTKFTINDNDPGSHSNRFINRSPHMEL